jgi:hypothetical protein
MSYHPFPNLRDIFQSRLKAKMIENIESIDFLTHPWNYRDPPDPPVPLGTTKPKRKKKKKKEDKLPCPYNNIWRTPIVIYQVACMTANKVYIGNTQQYFKNQMKGHFQDEICFVNKGVYSDLYTRHITSLAPRRERSNTWNAEEHDHVQDTMEGESNDCGEVVWIKILQTLFSRENRNHQTLVQPRV